MDKIFKERFENLEKKVPDYMLDNILSNIETDKPTKINYLKVAIWSVFAIASIAAAIILMPNTTKPKEFSQIKKNINIETPLEEIKNRDQNTIVEQSKIESKTSIERTKRVENFNTPILEKTILTSHQNKQEKPLTTTTKTDFRIIAPRYTCTGECLVRINQDIEGEWKANKSVYFQDRNSSTTIVSFNGEGRVLLTYLYKDTKDTFSVFFHKPMHLDYQIFPVSCGEENGRVQFDFPETRQFISTNSYTLIESTFMSLYPNDYIFEMEDNLSCKYQYKLNVPQENIRGNLTFDALDTRVNYPIYFAMDIDIDAEYIWDFGDGQRSYDKTPIHKYKTAGRYLVALQVIKNNCSESMQLDLEIKEKALEIPNIFTPNNDGINDVFTVTIPENTKSFEAYILNKNGQVIYKWTDPKKGWDGYTMSGQKSQSGSYYYVIKGVDSKNKTFEYKSFLELSR